MNSKKITSKLPHLPHPAPRGNHGAAHHAPSAPCVLRHGAVGHKKHEATRKKLQVVKECNPALSDHEVELMRVMHEEFPLGHPEHVGYRKLSKIFGCSYTHTANICRYRRRVAGL